jgi:hypothetical protein
MSYDMEFFAEIRYFMYDNQAKLVNLTSLIVIIPNLPILPSSAISRMLLLGHVVSGSLKL